MYVSNLPGLKGLQLDPVLRRMILERGGKVGPLEWVVQQLPDIPVLEHVPKREISFKEAKEIARKRSRNILVRSNNPCEYLAGTEGRFETFAVPPYETSGGEVIFRHLFDLPKLPATHLEQDWPKSVGDMMWAYVDFAGEDLFRCNMIEHPNKKDAFWMTVSNEINRKETYCSEDLDYFLEENPWRNEPQTKRRVDEMLKIARKISQLQGLDLRYSKQFEFVYDKKNLFLTQVKIFYPKNIVCPVQPEIPDRDKNSFHDEYLLKAFGVFDEVVDFNSQVKVIDALDKNKSHARYSQDHKVVMFKDAGGFLMHEDIPFLIYSKGAGVGKSPIHSYILEDGTFRRVKPEEFEGQRVRMRSDGHYIYASRV